MVVRREGIVMWYVYIIQCSDRSLYTGTTTDVCRRIREHNCNKGGSYTRVRKPVALVYKEPHPDRRSALIREAQIKRWTRSKKIAFVNGDLTTLNELSKSRD
jgi:putative endonuclease